MPVQGLGVINNDHQSRKAGEQKGEKGDKDAAESASCLVCRTLSAGAGVVRDSRNLELRVSPSIFLWPAFHSRLEETAITFLLKHTHTGHWGGDRGQVGWGCGD